MRIGGNFLIMNTTWQELEFFLKQLKSLPVSESIMLSENGFAVSTGCDIESWVFYPERVKDIKIARKVIEFFKAQKVSFMWPVYDGGEKVLEDAGLLYAGSLTGMVFDPAWHETLEVLIPKRKFKKTDPRIWACAAWHGFGGEYDDVPEKYFELVKSFSENKYFSLVTHQTGENHDGTFMIVEKPERKYDPLGLYYFATIPEMRRKGIAREMMYRICEFARGRKIFLQATPAGLPFYKDYGFEELCKIPVYSTTTDVF